MALILSGNQYGTAGSRLMRGYRDSTRQEIRDQAMATPLGATWEFTTTDVAGHEPSRGTKTVLARTFATPHCRASTSRASTSRASTSRASTSRASASRASAELA